MQNNLQPDHSGYVKLHRKILENHFLMNDNAAWLVFTKLMLIVGRQKGEWAGGRRQLAEYMGLNPNTLYKVLKRLEKHEIINITSNKRYTVYSICKWHEYQGNQQPTQQPHGNHTVTTRQHSNKNIIKNNIPPTPTTKLEPDVITVFTHYQTKFGMGNGFKLTPKRATKIRARLLDFGLETVLLAVDNASQDSWFRGGGSHGWQGDIDYLMRSYENIEKFANKQTKPPPDQDSYVQQKLKKLGVV